MLKDFPDKRLLFRFLIAVRNNSSLSVFSRGQLCSVIGYAKKNKLIMRVNKKGFHYFLSKKAHELLDSRKVYKYIAE